jgi:hypothetical protein
VFHTSLLLPFHDPQNFPNHFGSCAPRGPAALNPTYNFWDKKDVEAIVGFCCFYVCKTCKDLEYLVR